MITKRNIILLLFILGFNNLSSVEIKKFFFFTRHLRYEDVLKSFWPNKEKHIISSEINFIIQRNIPSTQYM